MILSDATIREQLFLGELVIKPDPCDRQIQPASIDLLLGNEIKWANGMSHYLDPSGFALSPGKFVLGHTNECITIPNHLVGQLNGKSSLGRRGLMVHVTAGYIDPGFHGEVTLELKNVGYETIYLEYKMPVAQLVLIQLTTPAIRPYGHSELNSHYQDQTGATPARN